MTPISSADRHRYLVEKYFVTFAETNLVERDCLIPILERLDNRNILSREDAQVLKEMGLFDSLKFVQGLRGAGWVLPTLVVNC